MSYGAERLRAEFFAKMADPTVIERVFSSIPDVVFCIKNRRQVYVAANDAFAERVGLGSRWEVVGKSAKDLFPEALASLYRQQDEEVLRSGEGFRDRMELLPTRDKGLGWHLATKFPVRGGRGAVIGLVSISRDLQVESGHRRGFGGLAKVVRKIETDYGERLERSELAKLADLSEPQLERRVRKVFGISVAGFIRKVRVEAGARMLTETELPLAEVATACGYAEQSAFTRQFKSAVGMPPGVYRREFGGWW
ncbi:MAG: AraC family transcriptional regulator [Verrucomicrobiota bacterium]